MFSTPRPVPARLWPALAGTLVVAVALPLFAIAGWPLSGWALAVVLWVALHLLDAVLRRVQARTGNLAASGVQVFGLFFKALVLLAVLLAVAVSHPHTAAGAAAVYAIAYTLEFGLLLLVYFSAEQ
jgi:hypothetical protein